MANQSISQLTSVTNLAGSSQIPVVQNSQTQKATALDIGGVTGSPIFQSDILYFGGTTTNLIGWDYGYQQSYIGFKYSEISAPYITSIKYSMYLYFNNATNPTNDVITSINMPLLETIGVGESSNYLLYIENAPLLQTINLSSLRELGDVAFTDYAIYIYNLPSLTTLNISNLETTGIDGQIYIYDLPLITSIDLSNLQTIGSAGSFTISSCPLLTTINISSLTNFNGSFDFSGNALNQATIDAVLNQLANVVFLSNQFVNLNGGTNAAPSVTGATYVALLISFGCTVTTN